jgi:DNA helicase HerA-like ATPase
VLHTHIGSIISVHGFRVKVELTQDCASPVRASAEGIQTAVAINSYLTFDIGAGELIIGVITDLDSTDSLTPGDETLTIELSRPKRILTVQLLGTLKVNDAKSYSFDPGITILPTLDTPAIPAAKDVLESVFASAPARNAPEEPESGVEYDKGMYIGEPVAALGQKALGSYNDLFSRPMAVVGNTGSGKSCTIAHLIQEAVKDIKNKRPKFFILDINGEYSSAFGVKHVDREPNKLYVNGKEFSIPLWLMNANEICHWLSATEQIQEPVLKNFWSLIKGGSSTEGAGFSDALEAQRNIDQLLIRVRGEGPYKGQNCFQLWGNFKSYIHSLTLTSSQGIIDRLEVLMSGNQNQHHALSEEREILQKLDELKAALNHEVGEQTHGRLAQESADKPIFFSISSVLDPSLMIEASADEEAQQNNLANWLRGLQLRMKNRLHDRRWNCFRNYEELGIQSFETWLKKLGVSSKSSDVVIIDCSMIANEVLPYITGILGRLVLDLREHIEANKRYHEPWVLVLEEAHNYIRPRKQIEDRGLVISREAFERVAKEGRKFGLSLVVASQRPSEISPTVISQCANFVMHRLQNPDDIEHFKRIVPSQSQRLLDQVTILAPGEALLVGSAFHVPARAKIRLPNPKPSSSSSMPYHAWKKPVRQRFDLQAALDNWLGRGD